jgi:hypothetical protein
VSKNSSNPDAPIFDFSFLGENLRNLRVEIFGPPSIHMGQKFLNLKNKKMLDNLLFLIWASKMKLSLQKCHESCIYSF